MLLRIFDRCQKWIVNYNRLVLLYLIILIIISILIDEKNSFANCQELETPNDLMTSETMISPRQTLPNTVSEFFGNNPAFATLLATLPSKIIGLIILRFIKQQQMQNQFVPIGGFNGINGGNNNCDGNGKGGKGGNNCNGNGNGNGFGNGFGNNGGDGDNDDDDGPRKTFMFFAGNGNIQVKNHKGLVLEIVSIFISNFRSILLFISNRNDGDDEEGGDSEEDLEKHYTLQV
jgi:hypothetical protein